MKHKKRISGKERIRRTVMIVLIAVFSAVLIYSGYKIYSILHERKVYRAMMDTVVEHAVTSPSRDAEVDDAPEKPAKEPYISVDFNWLKGENKDIVAWLYCPDTVIQYPVVKSKDNKDYERHTIYHKYNSNGTLFIDCNNEADLTEPNTIIYGHRMRSGEMFGSVPKYDKQSYYDKHPVWYLLTPEQNYRVELLASYSVPKDFYVYTPIQTAEEQAAFLADSLKRSTFKTKFTYEAGRRLVTFSTCGKNAETTRLLLIGQLVELPKEE